MNNLSKIELAGFIFAFVSPLLAQEFVFNFHTGGSYYYSQDYNCTDIHHGSQCCPNIENESDLERKARCKARAKAHIESQQEPGQYGEGSCQVTYDWVIANGEGVRYIDFCQKDSPKAYTNNIRTCNENESVFYYEVLCGYNVFLNRMENDFQVSAEFCQDAPSSFDAIPARIENEIPMNIYPNPVDLSQKLMVSFGIDRILTQQLNLEVYDLKGSKVHQQNIVVDQTYYSGACNEEVLPTVSSQEYELKVELDMQIKVAGMHIVVVRHGNQIVARKKLIVAH